MRSLVLVMLCCVVTGTGCATAPTVAPEAEAAGAGPLRVYAPAGGGVIADIAVERAAQSISRGEFVVAVAEGDSKVDTGIGGVSVVGRAGTATNYSGGGVAYAPYGGKVAGGANCVAFTRAGQASSGDGGVAVEKNGGLAECGSWGVAFSDTPRTTITGRVRGLDQSVLVIVGRKLVGGSLANVVRVAQVGTEVDGIRIEPGVWYGLDANLKFVKFVVP